MAHYGLGRSPGSTWRRPGCLLRAPQPENPLGLEFGGLILDDRAAGAGIPRAGWVCAPDRKPKARQWLADGERDILSRLLRIEKTRNLAGPAGGIATHYLRELEPASTDARLLATI